MTGVWKPPVGMRSDRVEFAVDDVRSPECGEKLPFVSRDSRDRETGPSPRPPTGMETVPPVPKRHRPSIKALCGTGV